MIRNEAAERLRGWIEWGNDAPSTVTVADVDAALAEERRHVIEQIREPLVELAALAGHAAHLVDRVTSALDDLSISETP